jgi:hypothetical protein
MGKPESVATLDVLSKTQSPASLTDSNLVGRAQSPYGFKGLTDFLDTIFKDIRVRGQKGGYFDPVVLNPPKKDFSIVREYVFQVVAPRDPGSR